MVNTKRWDYDKIFHVDIYEHTLRITQHGAGCGKWMKCIKKDQRLVDGLGSYWTEKEKIGHSFI